MKCKKCDKYHEKGHPHFETKAKIMDKGFPVHSKRYAAAHREANKEEKKKFGEKSFKKIDKIDRKLGKHELSGKNTKTGKIEVSKKVPKDLKKEIAYHEKVENKILRKK